MTMVRAAWPLADGPRDSLRFAFFTDVHARVEWQTPEAMAMAARAINARAPDLVIAGGDLITEGFERRVIGAKAVVTNTTPTEAYRGAGRPEANCLMERLIDKAARATGIDPVELRRVLSIPVGELSWR